MDDPDSLFLRKETGLSVSVSLNARSSRSRSFQCRCSYRCFPMSASCSRMRMTHLRCIRTMMPCLLLQNCFPTGWASVWSF